jgi:hypothetical protein
MENYLGKRADDSQQGFIEIDEKQELINFLQKSKNGFIAIAIDEKDKRQSLSEVIPFMDIASKTCCLTNEELILKIIEFLKTL